MNKDHLIIFGMVFFLVRAIFKTLTATVVVLIKSLVATWRGGKRLKKPDDV